MNEKQRQHDAEANRVIYTGLLTYGRGRILRNFARDSCIASTRVALLVLHRFGIRAVAMPCKVKVFNPMYWKRIREGVSDISKHLPGEWSVGIGYGYGPTQPGRMAFNGHLVAVTDPSRGVMVDLSIDQISRPNKGIFFQPLAGTFDGPQFGYETAGGTLQYDFDPTNTAYQESIYSTGQHSVINEIVNDTCNDIHERMRTQAARNGRNNAIA
ncbi:MAG TPA: hypothetical protein VNT99_17935 [Methylomirabilota bacterium]|nr:hypothetical protein [Methylomirabilota bacterium]